MLFPGNIYFIKNFNFEDGGMPSDKLLIILCIDNETSVIIRALTTSQAKVPEDKRNPGCTNNDTHSFFLFQEHKSIGKKPDQTEFTFDKPTYIFIRENVAIMQLSSVGQYLPDNFQLLAELNKDVFDRFLKCVRKSKHLKNKIKKILNNVFGE